MTSQDFETKTFDELMEQLNEEMDDIHSREIILEMIKNEIDEGNLFVAKHILNGVCDEYAEWYQYDRSMGTLDSVMDINAKEDIQHLIWD